MLVWGGVVFRCWVVALVWNIRKIFLSYTIFWVMRVELFSCVEAVFGDISSVIVGELRRMIDDLRKDVGLYRSSFADKKSLGKLR